MAKEPQRYIYETHLHTGETSKCGRIKGAEVARLYKAAGYDGIIVTDHYNRGYFEKPLSSRRWKRATWVEKIDKFLSGYKGALEEGKRIGVAVLLGMEIRFDGSHNDYLVYGFDEDFLRKYPKLYRMDLRGFRQLLQEKLGVGRFLIYQAHPYRAGISPANPLDLDGVEVYNGNPRHNSRNNLALRFAEKNQLKKISGSDFHRRMDLGRGGIVLPERVISVSQLIKLLNEERDIELKQATRVPLSFLRFLIGVADRFK